MTERQRLLALLALFFVLSPQTATDTLAQGDSATDRTTLSAFYDATDGPNWKTNSGWKTQAPLDDWFGVDVALTTSGEYRATELTLHSNQLTGSLPTDLRRLSELRELTLTFNDLSGPIPPELGQLAHLEKLNFYLNGFGGPIPSALGRLTSMEYLDLSQNDLSGPIPPDLGQLTNLQWLALAANNLSGPIPPELGRLSRLEHLDFRSNQLSGPIPSELGQLTNLEMLLFEFVGSLSGPIPPELGRLSKLRTLIITAAQLTGAIPAELGQLASLRGLDLGRNQLSGPIPAELGQLASLQALGLGGNQLSGPIPAELGLLTELIGLRLHNNQLSGPIPVELGLLTKLERLSLDTDTGLCLSEHFPLDSRFAALAMAHGVSTCATTPAAPKVLTLTGAPLPAEGGHPVTVVVALDSPALPNGTTVTLTTSGTADLDTDYSVSSLALTIAEGQTQGTVTITVIDDAEDDDGETIVVGAASTNPRLTAKPLTLTIEDNDGPPPTALTLTAEPLPAEGGETVTLAAALDNPAPPGGTTVTLTVSGTATLNTDFELSSSSITIAEGQVRGTAAITVIDDAEDDDGETVVLDAKSTNPTLVARQLALTIADNDDGPERTRTECLMEAEVQTGVSRSAVGWDPVVGACVRADDAEIEVAEEFIEACRVCWLLHGGSGARGLRISLTATENAGELIQCIRARLRAGGDLLIAGAVLAAVATGPVSAGVAAVAIVFGAAELSGIGARTLISRKLREWFGRGSDSERFLAGLADLTASDTVKVQSTNHNALRFEFDESGDLVFHYERAEPTVFVWTLMEGDTPVGSLVLPYTPRPTVVPVLPWPAIFAMGAACLTAGLVRLRLTHDGPSGA